MIRLVAVLAVQKQQDIETNEKAETNILSMKIVLEAQLKTKEITIDPENIDRLLRGTLLNQGIIQLAAEKAGIARTSEPEVKKSLGAHIGRALKEINKISEAKRRFTLTTLINNAIPAGMLKKSVDALWEVIDVAWREMTPLEKLEELGIQVPEKLRSTPLGIAAFIFSRDGMIALPNNLEGKNIDRNKIVSQLLAQADDEKAKNLIGVFQNDSEGKLGALLVLLDRFAAKNGLMLGR